MYVTDDGIETFSHLSAFNPANEKLPINVTPSSIANFSIDIAQKVIEHELSDKDRQEKLIEEWVDNCNLN